MIVKDSGKDRRVAVVLALVLLVLQLGVAPNIGIAGGRANLALVFVGCTCLGGEPSRAPVYGFVAGLAYDLCGSGPIGLMALLLTGCAWLLAVLDRPGVADDLGAAAAIFVPVALAVGLVYAAVLLACGISTSLVDAVFLRALPGAVLDVVSFVVCGVVLGHGGGSHAGGGLSMGGKGGRAPRAGSRGGKGKGGQYTLKRGL